MKISEKRQSELYAAIHDSVMDTRIAIRGGKQTDVDYALYKLVDHIWDRVKLALNIEGAE